MGGVVGEVENEKGEADESAHDGLESSISLLTVKCTAYSTHTAPARLSEKVLS